MAGRKGLMLVAVAGLLVGFSLQQAWSSTWYWACYGSIGGSNCPATCAPGILSCPTGVTSCNVTNPGGPTMVCMPSGLRSLQGLVLELAADSQPMRVAAVPTLVDQVIIPAFHN